MGIFYGKSVLNELMHKIMLEHLKD